MTRIGTRARNALVALALASAACDGSSGSGGGSGGGADETAPLAVVQLPPGPSLTDASALELSIRATDETGVAAVRAGGVAAVLGPDGLWSVTVPLRLGDNVIRVETQDVLGNTEPRAAEVAVRREDALWIEPDGAAFDTLVSEVLVLDAPSRALFGVHPLTGARSVLSGQGVGTGAPFQLPRDLDFVACLHAAVVTDGRADAVWLVDLGTGARSVLSSASIGGGPAPIDLHGIVVDEGRNRALVVDEVRAELLSVDLSTGERATLSSDTLGTGPSLALPRRVALDLARDRALVTVGLGPAIMAVALGSGNRTVLSGGAVGSGPAFVTPLDLIVDPLRDRALVADPGAKALYEVALSNGARRILSSASAGLGPTWLEPAGVALHLGGVPLVIDRSLDALFEVGALSGDRRIVTGLTRGTGPRFERPASLAWGGISAPGNVLVADRTALLSAALATGGRALVSGPGRGSGDPFAELADASVSLSPPVECVHVLDGGLQGIWSVDPLSGDRALLSGGGAGSGPDFQGPRRMAAESLPFPFGTCAPLLVVDHSLGGIAAILRVDLGTGERTILSDASHGLGPLLLDPVAIETDVGNAFVLDAQARSIVSIDTATGDRTNVFSLPAGLGTPTDLKLEPFVVRFLVLLADPPALVAVDVLNQSATVLSDATRGRGPAFGRPVALELLASSLTPIEPVVTAVLVLDSARSALLAVDVRSGDRTILAK